MNDDSPLPRRYGLPKLRSKARERLAQAYADDDLELEDYEHRVEAVEAASSVDEVLAVMQDVPDFAGNNEARGVGSAGSAGSAGGVGSAGGSGGSEVPSRPGSANRSPETRRASEAAAGDVGPGTAVQILGDRDLDVADLRGGAVRIFSLLGDTKVDLTRLGPGQTAEITDFGVLGDFKIEIPVGTEVVRHHLSILGDVVRKRAKDRDADGRPDDAGHDVPARRVVFRGFRLLGDVKIVER